MKLRIGNIYYDVENNNLMEYFGRSTFSKDFRCFLLNETPIKVTLDILNTELEHRIFYVGRIK
jgi:hypothetical protein